MALTTDDLQAISNLIQPLRNDMQDMKDDMQDMKDDMQNMKGNIQNLKSDMQDMKDDMQDVKTDIQNLKDDMQNMKDDMQNMKGDIGVLSNRMANVELTLENQTNHNIQLLAENHLSLVDKLNAAIRVQDKSILCEVQVSGLRRRVENLEREVAELKSGSASSSQ